MLYESTVYRNIVIKRYYFSLANSKTIKFFEINKSIMINHKGLIHMRHFKEYLNNWFRSIEKKRLNISNSNGSQYSSFITLYNSNNILK